MNHQLIFTADEREHMMSLANNIILRKANHDISLFIDTKTKQITLVGGKNEELQSVTLAINAQTTIKSGQWSLNGSYFKDMINDFQGDKSSLIIALNYGASRAYPRAKIAMFNNTLRSCYTGPIRDEHADFLETQQKNTSDSVPISTLQTMIEEIRTHIPFEMIALDHQAHLVRVQRNQDIQELALPESLNIPISMALTPAATEQLAYVCDHTDSDSVNVAIHNDTVTFSTPTHTLTSSLAGLAEFYQQAPVQYECEAKLIATIYDMKKELDTYHQRYPEIKQANTSHLLLEQDAMMVANIVPPFGFAKHIPVIDIQIKQTRLYRVNLREIIKVKIQSITDAKQMKLQILKAPDGTRVLAFYNDRNPYSPYTTVPIELDMTSLPEILKLKTESQENGESVSTLEPQLDLVGFMDV